MAIPTGLDQTIERVRLACATAKNGVATLAASDLRRLLDNAEAVADLRRQLAEERFAVEVLGGVLRAAEKEVADLRRQLAEAREVATARGEALGYAEADSDWGDAARTADAEDYPPTE